MPDGETAGIETAEGVPDDHIRSLHPRRCQQSIEIVGHRRSVAAPAAWVAPSVAGPVIGNDPADLGQFRNDGMPAQREGAGPRFDHDRHSRPAMVDDMEAPASDIDEPTRWRISPRVGAFTPKLIADVDN